MVASADVTEQIHLRDSNAGKTDNHTYSVCAFLIDRALHLL